LQNTNAQYTFSNTAAAMLMIINIWENIAGAKRYSRPCVLTLAG